MSHFLRKWLTISFLNLLLVAILGVILRYKIAFYLPFIQQKNVLNGHSHFAFAGWITQTLMVLLIQYIGSKSPERSIKKYRWLLYANLISAYGMLVCFIIQGYALFSITFSTLSIATSYFFAVQYWKDLDRMAERKPSHLWLKASLVFSVLSSFGAFGLTYLMVNKINHANLYLAAIYFFLHFQYNGWFLFAGMGLLVSKIETVNTNYYRLRTAFILFCGACIPAYLLSVLWLPFSRIIYWIIIAAVVAQLIGWIILLRVLLEIKPAIKQKFSKPGRTLLLLAAIAFSIKLLLQSGSVHPALSQLSYGFRPIIIGYLHLVLLAVTSIFIIGFIVSFEFIPVTKLLLKGIYIFVAGIIINELLLMIEGTAALTYNSIPHIDHLLFLTAIILLSGAVIIFISMLQKTIPFNKVSPPNTPQDNELSIDKLLTPGSL
jgi:hypothetical protein